MTDATLVADLLETILSLEPVSPSHPKRARGSAWPHDAGSNGKPARRRGRYFFKFASALFLCSRVESLSRPVCKDGETFTYENVVWSFTTPRVLSTGIQYCWGHEAIAQGFVEFHRASPGMNGFAAEGRWKFLLGNMLLDADGEGFNRCWADVFPFFLKAEMAFRQGHEVDIAKDAASCGPLELPCVTNRQQADPKPPASPPSPEKTPDTENERARAAEEWEAPLFPTALPNALMHESFRVDALAKLFTEALCYLRDVPGVPMGNPQGSSGDGASAETEVPRLRERYAAGWVPVPVLLRALHNQWEGRRREAVYQEKQQKAPPTARAVASADGGATEAVGSEEVRLLSVLQALYALDTEQGWGLGCFLYHMNILGKVQLCVLPSPASTTALPCVWARASWMHTTPAVSQRVSSDRPSVVSRNPQVHSVTESAAASTPSRVEFYEFVEDDRSWYREIRQKTGRLCPAFRPFLVLYPADTMQRALDRMCDGAGHSVTKSVAELAAMLPAQASVSCAASARVAEVYANLLTHPRMPPLAGHTPPTCVAPGAHSERAEGTPASVDDRVNGWGAVLALAHRVCPYHPPVNVDQSLGHGGATPTKKTEGKSVKKAGRSFVAKIDDTFAARVLAAGWTGSSQAVLPFAPCDVVVRGADTLSLDPAGGNGSLGHIAAVIVPTARLDAVIADTRGSPENRLTPPAFVVPPHLMYACEAGKGMEGLPRFFIAATLFRVRAGVAARDDVDALRCMQPTASAVDVNLLADMVNHVSLRESPAPTDTAEDSARDTMVPAAEEHDTTANHSRSSSEAALGNSGDNCGASEGSVALRGSDSSEGNRADEKGYIGCDAPGTPVFVASSAAAAEDVLDDLRRQRCEVLKAALDEYMAQPKGGAALLKEMTNVDAAAEFPVTAGAIPAEEKQVTVAYTSLDKRTAMLLRRFASEVEAVRATTVLPITLLRYAEASAPGDVRDTDAVQTVPPPGSRKAMATLRRGFTAARWLPFQPEKVPSSGATAGAWEDRLFACQVELVHSGTSPPAAAAAAADASFRSAVLLVLDGETLQEPEGADRGHLTSTDMSQDAPLALQVRVPGAAPRAGRVPDLVASHSGPAAPSSVACSTVVRRASMVAWPLASAWPPELLVDLVLLPPLTKFLLQDHMHHHVVAGHLAPGHRLGAARPGTKPPMLATSSAAQPGVTQPWVRAEVKLMESDLRDLLLRVFYDKRTRERLEFLGDALLDFLCAMRVLTSPELLAKSDTEWSSNDITRDTRNAALAGHLAPGFRSTILAVCGGIAKEKTYADFVEALFGAMTVALLVMPMVRREAARRPVVDGDREAGNDDKVVPRSLPTDFRLLARAALRLQCLLGIPFFRNISD